MQDFLLLAKLTRHKLTTKNEREKEIVDLIMPTVSEYFFDTVYFIVLK
jgi:hypothetical protein